MEKEEEERERVCVCPEAHIHMPKAESRLPLTRAVTGDGDGDEVLFCRAELWQNYQYGQDKIACMPCIVVLLKVTGKH